MLWKSSVLLIAVMASLAGCASLNTVTSDVATYSQWPTARKPSTYAFERLPSQQANAQKQDELEAAARSALQAAGFSEADAKTADVVVQVGARTTRSEPYYYNDPFWWRGSFYYSRFGFGHPYWWRSGFGLNYTAEFPRYDREVGVLIRDRQSYQPLYEAHASSTGNMTSSNQLIAAMFEAALKDFPQTGINPRRVSVQLAASAK